MFDSSFFLKSYPYYCPFKKIFMKISYYSREKASELDGKTFVADIPNLSLPRIFPVNKDLKLLSCNDLNFDLYKSVFGFGFNTKSIWIDFPKFLRGNTIEYFLIGISFNYLCVDFKELDLIPTNEIKNIIEVLLNQDEQLLKILEDEFENFSKSISSSGLTSKNVSTFTVKVSYYLNLFLIMKIRESLYIMEEKPFYGGQYHT